MFNEDFRNYMKTKQYLFNERDEYLAERYSGKLTFNEVKELRLCALQQILIIYNVEVITDIPWGEGLVKYRDLWIKMMESANNRRK